MQYLKILKLSCYRFVNLLYLTNVTAESAWKIVKDTRKLFLKTSQSCLECDCIYQNYDIQKIISLNDIRNNNLILEQNFGINSSYNFVYEVNESTLLLAANLFTYMNYCPPSILLFYENNILHSSLSSMILAFTSIMKTSYDPIQSTSLKIWLKFKELLEKQSPSIKENMETQYKMSNHPVHLLDEKGHLMPTAMIPFCQFGTNISTMGVKIDQFDVPVCNSFKEKLVMDQLCYEVDPSKFQKDNSKEEELSLLLIIEYNHDRHFSITQKNNSLPIITSKEPVHFGKINKNRSYQIKVGTIGKVSTSKILLLEGRLAF